MYVFLCVCVCLRPYNIWKFNLLSGSIKHETFVITSVPGNNLKEKDHGNGMGKKLPKSELNIINLHVSTQEL